jgi:hypothetical protein
VSRVELLVVGLEPLGGLEVPAGIGDGEGYGVAGVDSCDRL